MAIAVTKDFPCSKRIGRNLRSLSGSVAFDSSYLTGGEPATDITRCFKACAQIICEQKSGYLFEFDKTNKKIKVFHPTVTLPAHDHDILITGGQAAGDALQQLAAVVGKTAAGDVTDTTSVQGTSGGAAQAGTEVPDAADLSGLTGVKFIAMGN